MIGPGETRIPGMAPKGNAETLRQKGRAMTILRRVRRQPYAEGATCCGIVIDAAVGNLSGA